ncbi:MAG: OprO/OprP family phosphate-selective porin [Bacteroidales bacterium]|nr:OprO/OprP family phosphate-selective porin [Bacteroidales bacterium]
MKKLLAITIFTAVSIYGYSQTQEIDSLNDVVEKHEGKLNALDERVLVNEADLGKLNKIKVSGYIQAQWETYGKDLEKSNGYSNTYYIRRARVKFTYEALDGVKFVLQPDFSTGNLALKDAYAVVNIPKLKNLTLWAGQFNRPDYEVEYSSSQREVLERSRVIRAIYPGEREIGLKLEYIGVNIPLKVQLMAMNGNFTGAQAKDIDSKKDLMGRIVYSIKLPGSGVGIDLGANGYLGGNLAKTNPYIKNSDGTADSIKVWSYLDKNWAGGEIQIFADFLGGMAIKGEYMAGVNSTPSTIASTAIRTAMLADPNKYKNFAGYYIYFIKNIGSKNQFVAKYDYYDPNTKLSGDAASKDIYYKTWTLAWQHYLNDNIRISLNYEMPKNEINASYPAQLKDNTLGVRIQAKF